MEKHVRGRKKCDMCIYMCKKEFPYKAYLKRHQQRCKICRKLLNEAPHVCKVLQVKLPENRLGGSRKRKRESSSRTASKAASNGESSSNVAGPSNVGSTATAAGSADVVQPSGSYSQFEELIAKLSVEYDVDIPPELGINMEFAMFIECGPFERYESRQIASSSPRDIETSDAADIDSTPHDEVRYFIFVVVVVVLCPVIYALFLFLFLFLLGGQCIRLINFSFSFPGNRSLFSSS